jgi:hypothetical protein
MPAMEARRAGKNHKCSACRSLIRRGTIYLLHTTFPSDDYSAWRVPVQSHECSDCAALYGRSEPIKARRRLEKNKAQARYLKRKKVAA